MGLDTQMFIFFSGKTGFPPKSRIANNIINLNAIFDFLKSIFFEGVLIFLDSIVIMFDPPQPPGGL